MAAGTGIIVALALLLAAPPSAADGAEVERAGPEKAGPGDTVVAFIEAYNARDFAAYERLMAEDIAWYSVDGAEIALEAQGRADILDWTRAYLTEGCSSCRSSLVSVMESGSHVSTVEKAIWTDKDGQCRIQSSPAVYRVETGRIAAVWYFPASTAQAC